MNNRERKNSSFDEKIDKQKERSFFGGGGSSGTIIDSIAGKVGFNSKSSEDRDEFNGSNERSMPKPDRNTNTSNYGNNFEEPVPQPRERGLSNFKMDNFTNASNHDKREEPNRARSINPRYGLSSFIPSAILGHNENGGNHHPNNGGNHGGVRHGNNNGNKLLSPQFAAHSLNGAKQRLDHSGYRLKSPPLSGYKDRILAIEPHFHRAVDFVSCVPDFVLRFLDRNLPKYFSTRTSHFIVDIANVSVELTLFIIMTAGLIVYMFLHYLSIGHEEGRQRNIE